MSKAGEKRQIIATILINNKLTYANEANGGYPKGRDHGGNFNVITKERERESARARGKVR